MAKRSLYTRGEARPRFSTDKDALQVEPTPSHWFHCSGSTGPKRSNLRLWEAQAQRSWQQPPSCSGLLPVPSSKGDTAGQEGSVESSMVGRELGQIRTCYYTGPALQSPELSIWVSPTSLSRANAPAISCATLVRSQVAESQKPPHPHPLSLWDSSRSCQHSSCFPYYSTCFGSKQNQGPLGSGRQISEFQP